MYTILRAAYLVPPYASRFPQSTDCTTGNVYRISLMHLDSIENYGFPYCGPTPDGTNLPILLALSLVYSSSSIGTALVPYQVPGSNPPQYYGGSIVVVGFGSTRKNILHHWFIAMSLWPLGGFFISWLCDDDKTSEIMTNADRCRQINNHGICRESRIRLKWLTCGMGHEWNSNRMEFKTQNNSSDKKGTSSFISWALNFLSFGTHRTTT